MSIIIVFQAYYSERVGTLKEYGAKKILLGFFLGSQSIIANYFPVKVTSYIIHTYIQYLIGKKVISNLWIFYLSWMPQKSKIHIFA